MKPFSTHVLDKGKVSQHSQNDVIPLGVPLRNCQKRGTQCPQDMQNRAKNAISEAKRRLSKRRGSLPSCPGENLEYVVYRKHFNGNTLVRCECGFVCDFVLHRTASNRISLEAVRWELTFSFPPLANYFGISEHV